MQAWRSALTILLLAHAALALVLTARSFGWLEQLELAAYDVFLRHTSFGGELSPIVVVGFDSNDEQRFHSPLPDLHLVRLLEQITAQDPVAIGLDLIRDRAEPQRAPADLHQRLQKLLRSDGRIIAITAGQNEGFRPPPALESQPLRVAVADIPRDRDGVIRRGLVLMETTEGKRLSLAALLAARWLKVQGTAIRGRRTHIDLGAATYSRWSAGSSSAYRASSTKDRGYQFLLTFPACPRGFPEVSVGQVLDGEEPATFRGALVLIGNTTPHAKDILDVPVSCGLSESQIYGVHLHAVIADQLIGEAKGRSRQLETTAQRLGPALAAWTERGWTWVWAMLGGIVGASTGSTLSFVAVAVVGFALSLGIGFLFFLFAGLWIPVIPPALAFLVSLVVVVAFVMTRNRLERELVMSLFRASVSRRVADYIWRRMQAGNDVRANTIEQMTATVLFSDIKGFTGISERLSEPELVTWLNGYMETMIEIIEQHNGVIEKFAGDGVTASFGVPIPRISAEEIDRDARDAVDCALAMGATLPHLNACWSRCGLPEVALRVGIHTGPLVAAPVGTADRWQYSLVGDTANTAARLESYGKDDPALTCDPGHCRILVSEQTLDRLNHTYVADPVGSLPLRGKSRPVTVHRIIGKAIIGEGERHYV